MGVNAYWPWAQRELLGRTPRRPARCARRHGPSALNLYLGVLGELDGLRAHDVDFGDDYEGNFTDVFADRVHDGRAYDVHEPPLTDPSLASEGQHVVYVLVPHANSDADIDREHERDHVRRYVLDDLADKGWDIRDRIVCEEVLAPPRWAEEFSLDRGATFGLSHNVTQVGWFRPHDRDPELERLYYVSSSTHPGAGVPMVILSARLVTERITEDHPPVRVMEPQSA